MSARFPFGAPAPVIAVVGRGKSGKTALIERLIGRFVRQGLDIAAVRYSIEDFDIDRPGTDSARFTEGGARCVAIGSDRRTAVIAQLDDAAPAGLAEALARLAPCDLVIVEGLEGTTVPQIEVRRQACGPYAASHPQDPAVIALATDHPVVGANAPVFDVNDTESIADFILAACRGAATFQTQ